MSQALRLLPSSAESKWTVVSGAMAGAVKLLPAQSFSIGRSPECELVIINDPKVSRKHATVTFQNGQWSIQSASEKNTIRVNGAEVTAAILADNDVVNVGDTDIRFNHTHREVQAPAPYQPAPIKRPSPAPPRRAKNKKQGSSRIYIYGAVALVILFFVFDNSKKKKEAQQIRTEQQIQADIDAANKLQEAALNRPNRRFDTSVPARQAQENYVRGFRDFRKGQFERALESFRACLALDPTHVLCNRYIRLAQRRFSEIVQYNMVLGRKYRDQNQFKACRAAFRNVMVMSKDANSPTYKEAKANYDACNALLEGRY